MTDHRPPQISENEAHIWKALADAADLAERANFALARARQMILRDEPGDPDAPFWRFATHLLHAAGVFASDTLAERQRIARQYPDLPDLPLPEKP